MKMTLLVLGLVSALVPSEVHAFDYAAPILVSGEDASLDFGTGERSFYYNIVSELIDPFGQPYYRVSLALASKESGRVLRSGPSRIHFSGGENVSISSQELVGPGGGNRLPLGGYDEFQTADGWFYSDYFQGTSLDWWRRLTEVLIGLRFQLDDGVHHGWIRFSRADTQFTTVFQPKEYDWNPIPDAPIGAGQPPVIPIATAVTEQGLHLSWPPILATWTLESTGSLSDAAIWVSVPEATGYEARLEITDASRYFRLRKP